MRSAFFDEILKKTLGKKYKVKSTDGDVIDISTAIRMSATELEATFDLRSKMKGSMESLLPDIDKAVEERISLLVQDMASQDIYDEKSKKVITRREKIIAPPISADTQLRDKRGRIMSPLSLTRIVNLSLAKYVRDNMGTPALRYRTGRLANSAVINGVTKGKQKFSVMFSYMTAPYATFEKGGAQYGDGRRSPKMLIRKAIKQALEDILSPKSYKNRFIIRGRDI